MSHWHLQLSNEAGTVIADHQLLLQWDGDSQLVHVEGTVRDGSSWYFTRIRGDAQPRNEHVCDVGKSCLFGHV